jgi:hypothetical protein
MSRKTKSRPRAPEAKDPGATRRRTLVVLRDFQISAHTIDEVAIALSMSPRTVTRMVHDAVSVGFEKRHCSKCGRFLLVASGDREGTR